MNWLEISVETEAAAVETVSAILHEHGEGGVAVHQDVIPDGEDGSYHYDTSRPTIVTTYVPATPDGARRRDAIAAALGHLTAFNLAEIGPVRSRGVAEEDWANAWKQFYHPMRFGRRLVVKPSWHDFAPRREDLVIELDPGMAFGTGLHQTTAMCMELLEDYVRPGASVLDQGCGSGILTIGAGLLGATRIVAVDTSEVAVAATRDNVALNGLSDAVIVMQGNTVPTPPIPIGAHTSTQALPELPEAFDAIIANIIADVIIAMAPRFVEALAPGGALIASGIIREREPDVLAAFAAAGLAVVRREARDEWLAFVAAREP